MEPQALYNQLGRLSETTPSFETIPSGSIENRQWFGRLVAIAKIMGDEYAVNEIRKNVEIMFGTTARPELQGFQTRYFEEWAQEVRTAASVCFAIMYQLLAESEMLAPASAQGTFIPAGNSLDAMAAVGKVLASAKTSILIVDPYMDAKALTDFGALASPGVTIRLLADGKHHKPTLSPATQRWIAQYKETRPLETRLTPERTLHDRLIIIDDETVWVLTQSLNAFASRSPATIVRSDGDAAALKVEAYQNMWISASPL